MNRQHEQGGIHTGHNISVGFNDALPEIPDIELRSPACILVGVSGQCVASAKTLTASGGSESLQLAKVHGMVMLNMFKGEITRIGTFTNMTGIYLDVYDGTVATEITLAPGPNMNGYSLGSVIIRDGRVSDNLHQMNADQVRVRNADNDMYLRPVIINQKYGADTYLRFNYTTTDTPIDVDFNFWYRFITIAGGYLEAV